MCSQINAEAQSEGLHFMRLFIMTNKHNEFQRFGSRPVHHSKSNRKMGITKNALQCQHLPQEYHSHIYHTHAQTQQHQNCRWQSCSKRPRFHDQRPFLWTKLREREYVYGCHCPSYSYFVKEKRAIHTGHDGQIALTRGIIGK